MVGEHAAIKLYLGKVGDVVSNERIAAMKVAQEIGDEEHCTHVRWDLEHGGGASEVPSWALVPNATLSKVSPPQNYNHTSQEHKREVLRRAQRLDPSSFDPPLLIDNEIPTMNEDTLALWFAHCAWAVSGQNPAEWCTLGFLPFQCARVAFALLEEDNKTDENVLAMERYCKIAEYLMACKKVIFLPI